MVLQHKKDQHSDLCFQWVVQLRVTKMTSSVYRLTHASACASTTAAPGTSSTSATSVSRTPTTQSSVVAQSSKHATPEAFVPALSKVEKKTMAGAQQSSRETGEHALNAASISSVADLTSHRDGDPHSGVEEEATEHPQSSKEGGPRPELSDPKLRSKTSVILKDFLNCSSQKEFSNLLTTNKILVLQLDPAIRLSEAALDMLLKFTKS